MRSSTEDELVAATSGAVLVLTLNRPSKRNALTVSLVGALADAISAAEHSEVRAIVITGAGTAFCAGGDLVELTAVADRGASSVTTMIYENFHRLVRSIIECPLPVIAAVNGAALGAGLDLALVCDVRMAAKGAVFASSWISLGLVPGMGGALWLTRLIGTSRATRLVLTGERFDAATAYDWGLLTDVRPSDDVLATALGLAERLAAQPPRALALSKAALRRSADASAAMELAVLGAQQATLLTGPEFANRTQRFRTRDADAH